MAEDFMLDDKTIKNKGNLASDILKNLMESLNEADEAIKDAYHEINKHDELDHVHYESFDDDLREFNEYRHKYDEFTDYADEYEARVDNKFKENMEKVCNKLSDIRLEDIQIDNNLGIIDPEGSHNDTFGGTRLKYKINIQDLLNVDSVDEAMRAEHEERRQMSEAMKKMVEEDNWPEGMSEDNREIIRQYVNSLDGGEMENYDDEIKNLLTQGEFNFITKGEQNLSLALDLTPVVGDVKGIIESCTGKEMITKRELSDEERAMSGISSAIGIIPGVGEIGAIAKVGEKLGAKAAIKEAAKYTVKETLQGAGMYGASSIATDLGMTPEEQLMAIGGMSLFRSGKAALKNPEVNAALNNAADITKATVKDAIESNAGSVALNSNFAGTIKQLHDSFKKVTEERKAFRESIADGESSLIITSVPKNTKDIKIKEANVSIQSSVDKIEKDIEAEIENTTEGVSNYSAREIISERVNGLDLSEHELTNKQLNSKKMSAIKSKIDDRTATKTEYEAYEWNKRFSARRREGVKQFWNQERERIINGESTTRNWTTEQNKDILDAKTPKYDGKSIQGHHSYSASKYPHLSNKGEIIYPVTPHEHLRGWHGGNFKNSNPGEPIIDINDF